MGWAIETEWQDYLKRRVPVNIGTNIGTIAFFSHLIHPMQDRLKIGLSACFFHPNPKRDAFASKTLQYIEQSMAHWVMSGGALPVMIPSPTDNTARAEVTADDYAQWLDGLVLHGGADVWPGSYGETPGHASWHGDRIRDDYELALVKAFVAAGKPVFGICRGLQLINVAFGGTLIQDIPTQHPNAAAHRHADLYEHNFHALEIVPKTRLSALIACSNSYKINSIHHQGIKDLAPGFVVEARCPEDGMVEAIQWHPEFHRPEHGVLDDTPLLLDFLQAAQQARLAATPKS